MILFVLLFIKLVELTPLNKMALLPTNPTPPPPPPKKKKKSMVSCWHLAVQYRGTKTLLLFSIVLTTCHLINLMPFTVLNQKFLFSLLFPNCSPFPLLIHLFVIFLVLDPSQDKLSIRPHKCVFLVHSRKGLSIF